MREMSFIVAFIHTVPSLVEPFNDLSKQLLPSNNQVFHFADETLLRMTLVTGGPTHFIYRRETEYVTAAEAGADLIQLTCSSISPTAETAQRMVDVPVLKIDEPMIDRALKYVRRIGVAATAPTTLKRTQEQVYAWAKIMNASVTVDAFLCEGAYTALFNGDTQTHDRIVREGLVQLMQRNDVVLLAQTSMARVADQLNEGELLVPVLSSPRLAMQKIKEWMFERTR
jgi:aspartate/glutamate racemase